MAKVVGQPTLLTHAGPEEFRAGLYEWLLDHPDRTASAWRRVGVPCIGITDLGKGKYHWTDGQGSDITWQTIVYTGDTRVWLAEGQARVGNLLPLMPVKAVAVLRFRKKTNEDGGMQVRHEVDVYLQTDSKAAALVTKLLGPTAPRMAEQGAQQLLMFFSAMSQHMEKHPEQVGQILR